SPQGQPYPLALPFLITKVTNLRRPGGPFRSSPSTPAQGRSRRLAGSRSRRIRHGPSRVGQHGGMPTGDDDDPPRVPSWITPKASEGGAGARAGGALPPLRP